MRAAVAFAAGVLTLAISWPVAAQEFKPPPNLFGQKTPAPKPPKVDWNWRPQAAVQPAKPSVVCGMTVVPADPRIDPKMRVAPRDTGVAFTLRTVQPTVCQGSQR